MHIKLLVKSRVALLRLLGSIASLRITKVSRIDSTRDVLNYDKLRTFWRVYMVENVGLSMLPPSNISHNGKGSSDMTGRPIENLSHDQSCRNKGHPRIADLSVCNTLHIARYVAAKTAEPQLLRLMCSGNVASAISCAKGM